MSAEFWNLEDVYTCDGCEEPMIANISTGDNDGYGWICTTGNCPEFSGGEIEAEDLIAVGVPEWVAKRIEALADYILE